MSVLHHEELLEDCFETAWENFRVSNKLTDHELNELCTFSKGTMLAIQRQAERLFEDLCE